jgi:hypothetical protein
VPGGLLTDLYELHMAASYLRRSVTGQATFSLSVVSGGTGFRRFLGIRLGAGAGVAAAGQPRKESLTVLASASRGPPST